MCRLRILARADYLLGLSELFYQESRNGVNHPEQVLRTH